MLRKIEKQLQEKLQDEESASNSSGGSPTSKKFIEKQANKIKELTS